MKPNCPAMNNTGAGAAQNSISADGELLLYGVIGDWWDDLDAETVITQLEQLPGEQIVVRIHSGGGYIMDGLAIYNRLLQSEKQVVVYVDGIAASMASVIAMAGDTIIMPDNALMMIHKPWLSMSGDAEQLRKEADTLDQMEESLVTIYAGRTGLEADVIKEMLAEETWMNGEEARTQGFADEVIESIRAAASIDLSAVNPPQAMIDALISTQAALPAHHNPQENPDMNNTGTPAAQSPAASPQPAAQSPADPAATEEAVNAASQAASEQATREERNRVATLREVAVQASVEDSVLDGWINDGISVDDARAQALSSVAARDTADTPAAHHVTAGTPVDRAPLRSAVASAIMHRVNPADHQLDEQSGQFQGMTLVETARAFIDMTGGNTRGMNRSQLVQMAMSTSDFPLILADVAQRTLQEAYGAEERNYTAFCRQSNATDFRSKHSLQIGAGEGLEKVNESGEFKRGKISEGKESYKLETHGRIFTFSRQLIINDDIGALMQFLQGAGSLAIRKEKDVIYDLIKSNPALNDGTAAFHADHGNLVSSGTGITETGLNNVRKLMRRQKGLEGESINVAPSVLLVNSERELAAQKMLAAVIASASGDVNPFANTMQLVVESRLDGVTNNPWYAFAAPGQLAAIEYAYLEGEEGPVLETSTGFDVDGMDFKVRLDFGAGWINHRGAVKNPGS